MRPTLKSAAFTADSNGVLLSLRVTPNAAASHIDGFERRDDGVTVLRIRVTAPPDRGKANKAVIALLAKHLGLAKSAITLISGDAARNKLLRLSGNADDLIARLMRI